MQATEGMTLDEFPTLRHVLNFLQGTPMKGEDAAPAAPTPTPAGVAGQPLSAMANGSAAHTAVSAPPASPAVAIKAGGPASEQLETFLINFVVEQTGYPPEVVELDADWKPTWALTASRSAAVWRTGRVLRRASHRRDDARRVPDAAACLELLAGCADEGGSPSFFCTSRTYLKRFNRGGAATASCSAANSAFIRGLRGDSPRGNRHSCR